MCSVGGAAHAHLSGSPVATAACRETSRDKAVLLMMRPFTADIHLPLLGAARTAAVESNQKLQMDNALRPTIDTPPSNLETLAACV